MFMMEHTVHLSDTDATGQVYYARPLEWLEWCRVDWFNKAFGDFMAEVQKTGITFFPTRVEVDYKRPMFTGDHVVIEMTATDIRNISFVLDYAVKRQNETVLTSRITIVCFDTVKKRPTRINETQLKAVRETLSSHQSPELSA
jgi:YbgC/YbaW family acyl-CoA thioester hydrolase